MGVINVYVSGLRVHASIVTVSKLLAITGRLLRLTEPTRCFWLQRSEGKLLTLVYAGVIETYLCRCYSDLSIQVLQTRQCSCYRDLSVQVLLRLVYAAVIETCLCSC